MQSAAVTEVGIENSFKYASRSGLTKSLYAEKLDKLRGEAQSRHQPNFALGYCYYAGPYDCSQFQSYLKQWWATIKFEFKCRPDKEVRSCFVGIAERFT